MYFPVPAAPVSRSKNRHFFGSFIFVVLDYTTITGNSWIRIESELPTAYRWHPHKLYGCINWNVVNQAAKISLPATTTGEYRSILDKLRRRGKR